MQPIKAGDYVFILMMMRFAKVEAFQVGSVTKTAWLKIGKDSVPFVSLEFQNKYIVRSYALRGGRKMETPLYTANQLISFVGWVCIALIIGWFLTTK